MWILGVGRDKQLGWASRSVALLLSDSFVMPLFLDHLPGLSVEPMAFLIMSDKLLQFIQL